MNKERLLKLADLLDTVPEDKFDYNTWCGDMAVPRTGINALVCGSTACALGWATAIPEFGICLAEGNDGIGVVFQEDIDSYLLKTSEYAASIATAMRLFDLSAKEADCLFAEAGNYMTKSSEAAALIREFVETGKLRDFKSSK